MAFGFQILVVSFSSSFSFFLLSSVAFQTNVIICSICSVEDPKRNCWVVERKKLAPSECTI
jgi:hypothetical protein